MKAMMFGALALAAGFAGAAGAETAEAVLGKARAACAGFENGVLDVGDGAVRRVDLTGDGAPEIVVDESHLACSSAASLFCGTGGCGLTLLVEGAPTRLLAQGWRVIDWYGTPVLLLAVHGSECGGIGPTRCFRALVWGGDRFETVR